MLPGMLNQVMIHFLSPRRVAVPPRSATRIHHPSPVLLDSPSADPASCRMGSTERKCKILAESVDWIDTTNMEIEGRRAKAQELLLHTQLEYFKMREIKY